MPFILISALSQEQIVALNANPSKIVIPTSLLELSNLYNNDYIISNKLLTSANLLGIVYSGNGLL